MVEPVVVAAMTSGRMTAGQAGGRMSAGLSGWDKRKTVDAVGTASFDTVSTPRRSYDCGGGKPKQDKREPPLQQNGGEHWFARGYPHVQLHNGA